MIDLCARMVVGWAMSERMTAGIVVEALERAWRRGYVAGNAIFHSDCGSSAANIVETVDVDVDTRK